MSRHSLMRVKERKLDLQNLRSAFVPPRPSASGHAFQIWSRHTKSESLKANFWCALCAASFWSSGRSRGSGMLNPEAITSICGRTPSFRACSSIRPRVGSSGSRARSLPSCVSTFNSVIAPSSCSSRYPARIAACCGGSMNGKVSISPNPNAFILKITSARFARWISGCVKRGRFRKSSSLYKRIAIPSAMRPALPARWLALLWERSSIGNRFVLVRGLYLLMRDRPESTTYRILGRVSEVSATLVAMITLRRGPGAKMRC